MYFKDEPLSRHCAFEIGGPARIFSIPENLDEATRAISHALEKALPIFILGHGSNCLFSDRGFDGFILSTERLKGISWNQLTNDEVEVRALAGESFDVDGKDCLLLEAKDILALVK